MEYKDDNFNESLKSIKQLIYRSIGQSTRDAQYIDMSGETVDEDGNSLWPMDRLEKVLLNGLEQIKERKKHKHSWDEESGFCTGCGWDGNA